MSSSSASAFVDCTVVGASFAGLACATVLARRGLRVRVVERKQDPGDKLHTTGIIVKEVVDQIALLDRLPTDLVRQIPGIRLYAPNMRYVDLDAPGYYFLATDTPRVIRWLAAQAADAGVELVLGASFTGAARIRHGYRLEGLGETRYVIGADGPNSQVAKSLALGRNQKFLFGAEYEFAGPELTVGDRLHCFVDRKLAPGYIGWIVPGVGVTQIGLARRMPPEPEAMKRVMDKFLAKIGGVAAVRDCEPLAVRAGMIPCGGVVRPVAAERALLVGDAAGMVSPVTAGGIHTALKHGLAAGHAVAEFLEGKCEDPAGWFPASYPKFRVKRFLRFLFDHFQSDLLFNLTLSSRPMRMAASQIYFHRRGVLNPPPASRVIRQQVAESASEPRDSSPRSAEEESPPLQK
ncbi:NAD(P)/FAD-dependent oxidoreductase [Lacipirellula limnantheis]|uniref:Oxidoreductase n=1 Tax=Lacipirellula limnantheis TaxID=2528024 RepID=A0A517U309_9BACT|nr:NAD(P)/FAD-dependent oxidoreductase [Lacipirellula limnantheis]QDT75007.1 Putative oxidoreductase [Lacipirellula limnantheis]